MLHLSVRSGTDVARIFISHSSADNALAAALADWLKAEGFDDFFLDFEPERGIVAGERWERALHTAAARCEAVMVLVSRNWLGSEWCAREFDLAAKMSKRIFGVVVDDLSAGDIPTRYRTAWQLTFLGSGEDHRLFRVTVPPDGREAHVTFSDTGLRRLKAGLLAAGLDPKHFAWPPPNDPERAPYPGLAPLDAEDAGIFFGREAPLVGALDSLRALAERAGPRLFVILGASGAGKSSFLRAGLWPRLKRDDRHFFCLKVVRPGTAPITGSTGLIASLTQAAFDLGLGKSRADVAAAVGAPERALDLLRAVTEAARPALLPDEDKAPPLALVLSIDQAEELFAAPDRTEAEALLSLVARAAIAEDLHLVVIFTIRSEAYDALQSAAILEGLKQEPFSLEPMPRGAFETVIEGPARRLKGSRRAFTIDPALTDALLRDMEASGGRDTLPLLAFTLERLYREHAGKGTITAADYASMGGVAGSISAAVDEALAAARGDPGVPTERREQLALLRRSLIPWLAGIDPATGEVRRHIARRASLPVTALPLIDRLIEARLLLTYGAAEAGGTMIEPAHEALLRQWPEMLAWLEEDRSQLATIAGVRQATRDWLAHERDARWLAHAAGRLEDAEALRERPDLAAFLEADEEAYLGACRQKENVDRNRELEQARRIAEEAQRAAVAEKRGRRRALVGAGIAAVFALGATGAAGIAYVQADRAEKARAEAEAQRNRADVTLDAATHTANAVVSNLAQRFRNRAGVDVALVRSVLEEARKLQDTLMAGEAGTSPALMLSSAVALLEMSRTLLSAGDLSGARSASERSHSALLILAAEDPASVPVQQDLAMSYEVRGTIALRAGEVEAAQVAFAKGLAIAETLVQAGPVNSDIPHAVSVLYDDLGDVSLRMSDTRAARQAFEKSLAIRKVLAAAEPRFQRDLAISYERLGDLAVQTGDGAAAKAAVDQNLALRAALAKAEPDNLQAQRDLAIVYDRQGDVALRTGDLPAARAAFEKGLVIRKAVVAADPGNAVDQRSLAVSYDKQGDAAVRAGESQVARTAYEKALSITQTLAAADPNNAEVQDDLSARYRTLGDMALRFGDGAAARAAFTKSLSIDKALAEADPGNAEAKRKLALSYGRLGQVALRGGDGAAARSAFEASLAIQKALVKADPASAQSRRDLTAVYDNLGTLALRRGDSVSARAAFQSALEVSESLAAVDPGNAEVQRDLSVSYARVGDVARRSGDLTAARAAFDKSLAIRVRLAEAAPDDAEAQRDLAIAYDETGEMTLRAGDWSGAVTAFQKASDIRLRLAAADPSNAEAQRDLAISYNKLGGLALRAGITAAARSAFEKSLSIRKALASADPGNADARRDLSLAYNRMGDLEMKEGDTKAAQASFEQGLAIRQALVQADPTNAEARRDLSVSYERLGNVAAKSGASAAARQAFEQSLALRQALLDADPTNSGAREDLSLAYALVAGLAFDRGDMGAARAAYEKQLTLVRALVEARPADPESQRDLMLVYSNLADAGADSRANYGRALAILRKLKAEGHLAADDEPLIPKLAKLIADLPAH